MITIYNILKSKKFTPAHKTYLIAAIKIPFFLSYKVNKQSELISQSDRTIFRIREDLVYYKILSKFDRSSFIIDYKILKENL